MLITEIFNSIQGEGPFTGIPMHFIRTNRCNLRCRWCDSTYTFYGGKEIELDLILKGAVESGMKWVCFTGGEPLLQREAEKLVQLLSDKGINVLIETGGSIPVKSFTKFEHAFIDMDVKTPSSGEENSLYGDNLFYLRAQDYVKFVISDLRDYEYSKAFLARIPDNLQVIFQPAWGSDFRFLAESVLKDGLRVRVMGQLHKVIWGEVPGK